jgi:hypothetical protein
LGLELVEESDVRVINIDVDSNTTTSTSIVLEYVLEYIILALQYFATL